MKTDDKKRILIIEDESHIAEGLKLNLTLQEYEARIAVDGVAGLQIWKEWQPDLIILDIMLPGIDGLSVLQSIRLEDERIPVLILSAKSGTDDKVKGLSLGVDDYLTKPFDLEEFMLRVERLLTRLSWYEGEENQTEAAEAGSMQVMFFGGNRINFETATAECRRGKVRLTEQEVKLLKLFAAHPSKPLSRRKILQIGWGYSGSVTTRTVDNFIVRFRKYFEDDPKRPVHFRSVRSVGYVFEPGNH